MATTIQLSENAKKSLDSLKSGRETYEDVILQLMKFVEESKRKKEDLIIEGCNAMADENLKITKEFELIEDLDKWEW